VHAAPPVPQFVVDCDVFGRHAPVAVQQPFGHEVASQTHWPALVLHSVPSAQGTHPVPREPHEAFDSPPSDWQVPPLQQPSQILPPHVHAPPAHDSPTAHAEHAAPPPPHSDAVCDPKAMHAPVVSQQPPEHDVASQTQ
jgi:hypothetical protein